MQHPKHFPTLHVSPQHTPGSSSTAKAEPVYPTTAKRWGVTLSDGAAAFLLTFPLVAPFQNVLDQWAMHRLNAAVGSVLTDGAVPALDPSTAAALGVSPSSLGAVSMPTDVLGATDSLPMITPALHAVWWLTAFLLIRGLLEFFAGRSPIWTWWEMALVDATTQEPATPRQTAVRATVLILDNLFLLGLGRTLAWAGVGHRSLADRVAGTVVVQDRT